MGGVWEVAMSTQWLRQRLLLASPPALRATYLSHRAFLVVRKPPEDAVAFIPALLWQLR